MNSTRPSEAKEDTDTQAQNNHFFIVLRGKRKCFPFFNKVRAYNNNVCEDLIIDYQPFISNLT